MMRTVYFDNAATSYPKPPAVLRAVTEAALLYGNPGRGSHKLSTAAAELVYDCRNAAAGLFGAEPENIVFTLNATHALNLAVRGLIRPEDHILLDNYAHNAAFRPVAVHGNYTLYDASGDDEDILNSLRDSLRPETRMVVATHQSNVCSHTLPIEKIGRFCADYGLHFVVDASQSAGHLPIDCGKMHITALCLPGHKGLFSPMGVGLLIVSPDVRIDPLLYGGTGVHSLDPGMPEELPERLEAGTLPLPAIAGLLAGIRYVRRIGLDEIHLHERTLAADLTRSLTDLPGITFYGETDGPVIGFNLDGHTPAEVGAVLAGKGYCVRTGYHCAPVAHRTLGSFENGHIRVGLSYHNTATEVDRFARILRDMAET